MTEQKDHSSLTSEPSGLRHYLLHGNGRIFVAAAIAAVGAVAAAIVSQSSTGNEGPTSTVVVRGPATATSEKDAEDQPATTTPPTDTPEAVGRPESPPDPGPSPPRDGNSRLTAKPLVANVPKNASLSTEDDEDWYVYRAPRDEDVHLEFAKGTGEESSTDIVTVWEAQTEIESEQVASDVPFLLSRSLTKGSGLYVMVMDGCSPGCGEGPYQLTVTAGPAG